MMGKRPRRQDTRRAALNALSDRESELVVQSFVAVRWAIAQDYLTPSPLGKSDKSKTLQQLDELIERLGGPVGMGAYYHQQERRGVDSWTGKCITGDSFLPRWTEGDPARAALVLEYVEATTGGNQVLCDSLARVLEATPAGMPSPVEVCAALKEIKRRRAPVPVTEQDSALLPELPEAFADFIEQELDLSAFDQPRYQAGQKLLYWHTASKTWLPCTVAWAAPHETTYSVRTTFPNGKTRTVGNVPPAKLKPQE